MGLGWREPEGSATVRIQESAEDAARVQVREAQPVDRAVAADERRRPAVAEHCVVADRGVTVAAGALQLAANSRSSSSEVAIPRSRTSRSRTVSRSALTPNTTSP